MESELLKCLLTVSMTRDMRAFEKGVSAVMQSLGVQQWLMLVPPGTDNGGSVSVFLQGVSLDLGSSRFRELTTLFTSSKVESSDFENMAREFAPEGTRAYRVIRNNRERGPGLMVFSFFPSRIKNSGKLDESLAYACRFLDHCYLRIMGNQKQTLLGEVFKTLSREMGEGICILDSKQRVLYQNRFFREHMLLWVKGERAAQFSLPRITQFDQQWREGIANALHESTEDHANSRNAAGFSNRASGQRISRHLSSGDALEGHIRHLRLSEFAFSGNETFLLLTSKRKTGWTDSAGRNINLGQTFSLSPREIEVAEKILDGSPASKICQALGIAEPTVKTHIRNILGKAGVKTRLEFASLCLKMKTTDLQSGDRG